MEAWIGLLGTVIGAAIAGVILYFKDNKQRDFEKIRAKRELMLLKYEEIYNNISEYTNFSTELSLMMVGDAGYASKFDPTKLKSNLSNNKLKMNIMFYAPELTEVIKPLMTKYELISNMVASYVLEGGDKDKKSELAGKALIATKEMSQLAMKAKEELAILAATQVNL